MKKLFLGVLTLAIVAGTAYPQMMGGHGGMMGYPYGYYPQMGMMPMMHGMMGMGGMMPMMGMGGMGMMMDSETTKIIREHMMKCRKELMSKLSKRHDLMAERMLRMMTMHPESFKKALKKNPELKKKLKEMLK